MKKEHKSEEKKDVETGEWTGKQETKGWEGDGLEEAKKE